jgi:gluconokinase
MGVAASGKSTLGRALAKSLDWEFVEGDDYHPADNIEKMRHGLPLDDVDRLPWLESMNDYLLLLDKLGRSAVVACSALKQRYRDLLGRGVSNIRYVYLCGDPDLIQRRIVDRKGHFMPPDLLDSQLAAMEPPHDAIWVGVDMSLDDKVDLVQRSISQG